MLERGKMDRDAIEIVGIDSLVPQEHLLRKIDAAVDFNQLYEMVEPLYGEDNGRPSIDPVVLIKMILNFELQHNKQRWLPRIQKQPQNLYQLSYAGIMYAFQRLCKNSAAAHLEGL